MAALALLSTCLSMHFNCCWGAGVGGELGLAMKHSWPGARAPPAFTSQALGLYLCVTMTSLISFYCYREVLIYKDIYS